MKLPKGFKMNGLTRQWLLYILSGGIYPPWCIFAKPNNAPLSESESIYTKMLESVRKDIERFSDVLKDCFRILSHKLHEWSDELVILILQFCVIPHYMIVDMWEKGELRSEENEGREAVMRVIDQQNTGSITEMDIQESADDWSGLEYILERSCIIMDEQQ